MDLYLLIKFLKKYYNLKNLNVKNITRNVALNENLITMVISEILLAL